MWPCLARSKSFIAVARRNGGKTVGFLIPLINSLLSMDDYPPETEAPLAVIVCPTWKKCVEMDHTIQGIVRQSIFSGLFPFSLLNSS